MTNFKQTCMLSAGLFALFFTLAAHMTHTF